jgi:hypothetical protein
MKSQHTAQAQGLPSERYIEILTLGATHYGVEQSWIDWLHARQCTARKKPCDFQCFPIPDGGVPDMTMDEIKTFDGQEDRDLYVAINGKVIKVTVACRFICRFASFLDL